MKRKILNAHSSKVNETRLWGIMLIPALAGSIGLPAGVAYAQDEDTVRSVGVTEEILVTARRRTESIDDIPSSISVFSEASITRSNIEDVTDYFAKTPNVSFTESGTRGERDISIRGVSNIGGQVSALAFYVDDFNIVNGPKTANTGNANSSLNPQLQDVERIEVLRGPQGTFFGRNSTGGAINVITKKPGPDFYGEVTAGYERFDTWSIAGVVNAPLSSDGVYFRLSAMREEGDGAIRNVHPVGGSSDTEFSNVRAALRIMPDTRLTADFSVNYTNEHQGASALVATGVLSASSRGLAAAAGHGTAIEDGIGFFPENRWEYNRDVREWSKNRFLTLTGRLEYALDFMTVTSITGYLDSRHRSLSDLDGTSYAYVEQRVDVESDTFSQEIRFSSSGGGRLDWVIGGLYAKDTLNQTFAVTAGSGGFVGLPEGFRIDTGDIDFKTKSQAIFGELTWHATDRLDVTLGGRYSKDKVSQHVEGINFEVPDTPGSGKVSFSDFSPRLGLTYEFSDDATGYTTVSKGYKAGGLQLNVTQNLPVVDFDEEEIWNYEAGIRIHALDRRLNLNASVFYMDWKNLQVTTNVALLDPETDEITFLNTTSNAASATNKGFEVELRAVPVDAFRLGMTAGYLKAKFDKFPNAVVQGTVIDLSGKSIPRAPKWTLSADAEYNAALSDDIEGFVRAEWNYRSMTYPTVDSLVLAGFPYRALGFNVWNFRAGVEGERFSVSAYVENAFDKDYFTKTEDFGFAGIRLHPAVRTFGLKLTLRTK